MVRCETPEQEVPLPECHPRRRPRGRTEEGAETGVSGRLYSNVTGQVEEGSLVAEFEEETTP